MVVWNFTVLNKINVAKFVEVNIRMKMDGGSPPSFLIEGLDKG